MGKGIANDRSEESLAAKVRWFRSLSIEERMDWLCEMYERAVAANPNIVKQKMDEEVKELLRRGLRVRVLELPKGRAD